MYFACSEAMLCAVLGSGEIFSAVVGSEAMFSVFCG